MLILVIIAGAFALVQGLIMGPVDLSEPTDEWGIELAASQDWPSILWVDARILTAYEGQHYPGAVHLSEDDWDAGLGELLIQWDPDSRVVVYCDGQHCANSRKIAERLRSELGATDIYWLIGGWEVLQEELAR